MVRLASFWRSTGSSAAVWPFRFVRLAQRDQPLQRGAQADVADHREHVALVGERRERHAPALVDLADHVGRGHAHVLEEDLVELGLAGDLAERPDGDARRLHVDQDERDALVLGRARIGAHEEEAPFRHVRHAGPDLLAVDDVVVAVEHGARLEIGEVAARVGLGEALAPDLLGGEDLGEVPLALGRRAMPHDRRAEHATARCG